MKSKVLVFVVATALLGGTALSQMGGMKAETPQQLVESYSSLADALIAGKKTEWNLVHAILAGTYSHAQGTMADVSAKLAADGNAGAEVEKLASLISQLGTEGDAAVGAVRKRLVEAGHHHHAAPGDEEIYDPGYVIVTKAAKKVFLDAAGTIAKMGGAADPAVLATEWKKVETQFKGLHKGAHD